MRHFISRALLIALCVVSTSLFPLFASPALSALSDRDYLPHVEYDTAIPLPASVLGHPVGSWHVRHDQLVEYMRTLAATSERVSIIETGRTHENRPLILLAITSPQNQAQLESIKKAHIERVTKGERPKKNDPLVLYMGYSVHGNEPSGANASMLVAYYLASAQDSRVNELLNDNVVLLDPALNPDGLSRFAQWTNMHKGQNLVADSAHREHNEHWPSGRTNHYWFDLNRDWLLLTHPESQARISQFHQWRPHVLTDFHEMGTDSTYFFQPGIPSRKNPWTPDTNLTLTNALGDFHAAALDKTKQLYFTQEAFDDFYYGKGSTYPDAHGSIGILFEQASSRGHLQNSINGVLSFPDSIQNHVTTSLSTFEGALANKQAILAYQQQFFDDTKKLIKEDKIQGYAISSGGDATKLKQLSNILRSHRIVYSILNENADINDIEFLSEDAIFVPLDQPQYRLVRSLFSTRKSFVDNTFYDVSNWNLPLAFNLTYTELDRSERRKLSLEDSKDTAAISVVSRLESDAYAYAFEWQDYNAPALLQQLLDSKVQVRVAGKAFTAKLMEGEKQFAAGSILIPTALTQPSNLTTLLTKASQHTHIPIFNILSGLTSVGIDLGSRAFSPVHSPKVLLIGGRGTSEYEVGEIWHYLDTRIGIPATIVDLHQLGDTNLSEYTHIIFASGNYAKVSDNAQTSLQQWVKLGGTLIGQKSATKWFTEKKWLKASFMPSNVIDDAFSTAGLSFGDQSALRAKKIIAGAVYKTTIDTSHPLMFGFKSESLPMFKTSNIIMKLPENTFHRVASYTDEPLMAGYSAKELQKIIANTGAIAANRLGKGMVIGFVDNIHFRGYWYGTSKLMANSLYMSNLLVGR